MSIERTNPITGTEAQRRWLQANTATIEAAEEGASIGTQELHTSVDGAGLKRVFRCHENIGRTYHLGTVANEAAMLALDSPLTSHACLPGDTCFRSDTQQIMRCISNYGASLSDWEVVSRSADPAGTAASAVSTHNAAPDSHADIRTLVDAKQNTLTISDVGTALLNISTPASVQIPRINADGSVTLIDVPSGGGGGSGGWITHAGPPVGARTWVSNGDANGVVYLAGFTLGGGTFTNPCADGGPMAILRSSNGDGNAQQLTDRQTNVSYSANISGSWVCIDLGVYAPLLESYSLQHQSTYAVDYIRTWRLQGTNTISDWSSSGVGAASWTDLDVRSGDTTISGVNQWGHWVCNQAPSQVYRYLRLLQDGANSEGRHYLTTTEMEFYGALSITTPPPGVAAGWLKSTSVDLWMPYYGDSLDLGVVV